MRTAENNNGNYVLPGSIKDSVGNFIELATRNDVDLSAVRIDDLRADTERVLTRGSFYPGGYETDSLVDPFLREHSTLVRYISVIDLQLLGQDKQDVETQMLALSPETLSRERVLRERAVVVAMLESSLEQELSGDMFESIAHDRIRQMLDAGGEISIEDRIVLETYLGNTEEALKAAETSDGRIRLAVTAQLIKTGKLHFQEALDSRGITEYTDIGRPHTQDPLVIVQSAVEAGQLSFDEALGILGNWSQGTMSSSGQTSFYSDAINGLIESNHIHIGDVNAAVDEPDTHFGKTFGKKDGSYYFGMMISAIKAGQITYPGVKEKMQTSEYMMRLHRSYFSDTMLGSPPITRLLRAAMQNEQLDYDEAIQIVIDGVGDFFGPLKALDEATVLAEYAVSDMGVRPEQAYKGLVKVKVEATLQNEDASKTTGSLDDSLSQLYFAQASGGRCSHNFALQEVIKIAGLSEDDKKRYAQRLLEIALHSGQNERDIGYLVDRGTNAGLLTYNSVEKIRNHAEDNAKRGPLQFVKTPQEALALLA